MKRVYSINVLSQLPDHSGCIIYFVSFVASHYWEELRPSEFSFKIRVLVKL